MIFERSDYVQDIILSLKEKFNSDFVNSFDNCIMITIQNQKLNYQNNEGGRFHGTN